MAGCLSCAALNSVLESSNELNTFPPQAHQSLLRMGKEMPLPPRPLWPPKSRKMHIIQSASTPFTQLIIRRRGRRAANQSVLGLLACRGVYNMTYDLLLILTANIPSRSSGRELRRSWRVARAGRRQIVSGRALVRRTRGRVRVRRGRRPRWRRR